MLLVLKGRRINKRRKTQLWLTWLGVSYLLGSGLILDPLIMRWESITHDQGYEDHQGEPIHLYVMGAGLIGNADLPATQRLNATSRSRLLEAIRLQQMLPNAKIVTSGSGEDENNQARVVAEAAIELGVPDSLILMNELPFDTHSEARSYAERWGSTNSLIVVTSALHMRRAKAWFQYFGVERMLAAPCDRKVYGRNRIGRLVPRSSNFELWSMYLKELLGVGFFPYLK